MDPDARTDEYCVSDADPNSPTGDSHSDHPTYTGAQPSANHPAAGPA
jgi:hypothetical protein